MSSRKEKRLKKLKKQRIWPYILGIFMVVVVFTILAAMMMGFFVVNVVYEKVQQGYDTSQLVAKIVAEEWDGTNSDSMNTVQEEISRLLPNTTDICIVNEENEILYQSGANIPDFEFYMPNMGMQETALILTEDEDSLIYIKDGEIDFGFFEMVKQLENAPYILNENFWAQKEIITVDCWYDIPISDDGHRVCIKNAVPVRNAELVFVMMIVDVIVGLALVLIMYYLISLVSLVLERRKLAQILDTDVVTGGYNLQYFIRKGNKLLKKNRKGKYNYAVVTIRMEKYRNFCSCYGVKEGEELMESFYQVLNRGLSKKELLSHAEKADFALLLTYQTEEELVWRLKEMLIMMNGVKGEQKKYFSVGIFGVDGAENGIDGMYNYAGVARNQITEDCEDRIAWFNDKMHEEQLWNRTVENDMERALRAREFQVYLQPKYSTKEEVLSGAEALVRWIHPTEGFVPPYRFIPIFENNGFIIQLDDYMLTEVARQQAKWIAEGEKVVPISVNVSRVHFVKEDLAEHICELVDQFKVPHDVIELELTESAFFDDKEVLLNTIKKLKEYGFKISMDDFGAGYSSLNSLKELPLDVVKLDAEFFRDKGESGRGKLIVEDTISLAKKLNMRIVAEGIETREQVDFLADLNCDLIQGYYFAKPMPISEFEKRAFKENVVGE